MKNTLVWFGGFLLAAIVGYGGWHLERWINWRFHHGPAVEKRLESIEFRLRELENKIGEVSP
jgi:hypothetical protein